MRNYVNKQEIIQRLSSEIEQSHSDCIHINTIKRLLDDIDTLNDKEIRNKVIEKLVNEAMKQFTEFDLKHGYPTITDYQVILRDVAEQTKKVGIKYE